MVDRDEAAAELVPNAADVEPARSFEDVAGDEDASASKFVGRLVYVAVSDKFRESVDGDACVGFGASVDVDARDTSEEIVL